MESLTNVSKFIIMIKGMIKDTDEPPDEEIHRERPRRVLNSGDSIPYGVEVCHVPGVTVFIGPKALNTILLGFYGIFIPQVRSTINSIPSPAPVSGEWGWS